MRRAEVHDRNVAASALSFQDPEHLVDPEDPVLRPAGDLASTPARRAWRRRCWRPECALVDGPVIDCATGSPSSLARRARVDRHTRLRQVAGRPVEDELLVLVAAGAVREVVEQERLWFGNDRRTNRSDPHEEADATVVIVLDRLADRDRCPTMTPLPNWSSGSSRSKLTISMSTPHWLRNTTLGNPRHDASNTRAPASASRLTMRAATSNDARFLIESPLSLTSPTCHVRLGRTL